MSETIEYVDGFGRATDEKGTPLVPLTAIQACMGQTGEIVTIEEAKRTGVDPEAIGGLKRFYAYDEFYEIKERSIPCKDVPEKYWQMQDRNWQNLDVIKRWVGMISGEELRRNKSHEWFFPETKLADDLITNAIAILTTPYAGQSYWLGNKSMSYSNHTTLVGEAGHWLLHDPRTHEEALDQSSLTLVMCLELINDDLNADEGLGVSAVQEALRSRFGYLLDKECSYCGRTFGEDGE